MSPIKEGLRFVLLCDPFSVAATAKDESAYSAEVATTLALRSATQSREAGSSLRSTRGMRKKTEGGRNCASGFFKFVVVLS